MSAKIARAEGDIAQLTHALVEFERRAGIGSDEFFRQYQAGKMPETVDTMEWNALYKSRQRVLARLQILRSERGCAARNAVKISCWHFLFRSV